MQRNPDSVQDRGAWREIHTQADAIDKAIQQVRVGRG